MLREIDALKDRDISALSAWMFLELRFGCWGAVACFPACALSMRKRLVAMVLLVVTAMLPRVVPHIAFP